MLIYLLYLLIIFWCSFLSSSILLLYRRDENYEVKDSIFDRRKRHDYTIERIATIAIDTDIFMATRLALFLLCRAG